jgi:hypothetical protein
VRKKAPEGAHIIKKPPLLNCRLLCLVPTHREFALIFPWRPAIARVLRERRFATRVMMAADVAMCWLHAPRRATSSFFSLHAHKKAFFPAQSLLLTYWRQEPARQKSGCWARWRQGGRQNGFVLSHFGGGVLLGIMLAKHDARPLLKISSCVMAWFQAKAQLFYCNYVPAKIIVPKNPYRVFLQYQLVKYQENTN